MRGGSTLYRIRDLDGHRVELVVGDDGRWRDPAGSSPIGTVDGSSWWAVTGLADGHAHLGGSDLDHMNGHEGGVSLADARAHARAQLAGGVFVMMDKGGKNHLSLEVLHDPAAERPHLAVAGRVITSAGGYYGGFGLEVDEDGLDAAVESEAAAPGATWVKLIGDWPRKGVGAVPNFSGDALARAAATAHAGGCRMAIHACAPVTSTLAVAAGIDSIEHGLFLTADDIAVLGARGGCWVPTVVAMEGLRDMLGPTSSGGRLFAEGLENVRALLASAPGAGVTVMAGTDLRLAHGEVAVEAAKLVEYGLDPAAAVAAVTTAAYDYLGVAHGFRIGEPADVVFFTRHPVQDITVLSRPSLAVRHGVVVSDHRHD